MSSYLYDGSTKKVNLNDAEFDGKEFLLYYKNARLVNIGDPEFKMKKFCKMNFQIIVQDSITSMNLVVETGRI